jgi:spore coat polysaccharide biosynthesis protein SpsF
MIVGIIQARTGSTRLPKKVLKEILGKSMLERMLERVNESVKLDAIVVATTHKKEDDEIVKIAEKLGLGIFRGDEKDVLDRFYNAAKENEADIVVRMTGDCPLMDPEVIDEVIWHFLKANKEKNVDYTSTPVNYPEGLDIEAFSFNALETAWKNAKLPSEREHVTQYIQKHPELFKKEIWRKEKNKDEKREEDNSKMHWSVDTEKDFEFVTKIYEALYPINNFFSKDDILEYLKKHPEMLAINKGGTGYEGLEKSLKEDKEL